MGCPLRADRGHSSTHAGHRRELVRFVKQGFAQNHVQRCLGRWQPVSSVLTSALFGLHIERQRTISGLGDPRRPVATGIVAANPSPVRARVEHEKKRTLLLDRTKITRRFCFSREREKFTHKEKRALVGEPVRLHSGVVLVETVAAIVAAHRAGAITPEQTAARTFARIRAHGDPAIFISLRPEDDVLAESRALGAAGKTALPSVWRPGCGEGR